MLGLIIVGYVWQKLRRGSFWTLPTHKQPWEVPSRIRLTLFRIGWQKVNPTSFSPVTSINVGISPKNLLNFSFKPFPTLVWNFKGIPSAVPNYWTWTKTTLQKKRFLWSNSYKIQVIITFLIETLELPNFSHMTTSTIWFDSRDNISLVTSYTQIMTL